MASKAVELEELAQRLFITLSDSINQAIIQAATELNWRDARGRRLRFVKLYTGEHSFSREPWEDIFYVNLFFRDEEMPTLVGVGSLSRSEITVNMNLFPREFCDILYNRFFFSVIEVDETFEEIKERCLKAWRPA